MPPSCSNDHPKCHHATVRISQSSSSHLPIMVNPVGHSKFPGREPIATETQLRTRAQNERLWDNTLTRSNSQETFISASWKNFGSYLFLPSKDILLALGARKVSAKSLSVLASFQQRAMQCIKLYATRKQPMNTSIPVLQTQLKRKFFLISWQMGLGWFNASVLQVMWSLLRSYYFARLAWNKTGLGILFFFFL